jgi:glycosyltransferase involved in cell wall biosynthesis
MKILCVGFPAWEGDYIKSTVQLMGGLAKHHEVLYVEYPFTILDTLKPSSKPTARILGFKPRLRTFHEGNGTALHVLTLPPFLPANSLKKEKVYDLFNRINARRAADYIKKSLTKLNWKPDIVVNALNPMLGVPLQKYFADLPLVYYCYDEITAAPWLKEHGGRYEKQMLKLANAVICTSNTLTQHKALDAKEIATVKNGVDLENFNSASYTPIKDSKPIIGYLGSVDSRLDYSLLYTVATNIPKAQLVLVGRVNANEASILQSLPNVVMRGAMPPHQLPQIVQSFDVCLIPFQCNALTAAIYPMKINEYLACGKPVVSTNFTELTEFKNLIHIANDHADFLFGVGQALATNQEPYFSARRAFAESNSWESRCNEFEKVLSSVIQRQIASRLQTQSEIHLNPILQRQL